MISEQLLTQVQSLLQATGSQEQLTISATTFQSANIASLLNTYYDGNAIVLQNASVQSTDASTNMVSISGTTSFMNIEHAAVRVSLQETDADVEMIVKYTLPPTWKFSQSFPTLPVSWDPRQPAGSPQYSLLD
ncbi:MAG TPA: hypothetical protein VFB12_21730, partial [Ktedonobacteraceae bacterium]|nr:hypothetical protein [Ktedonobacteraceae bacterium]